MAASPPSPSPSWVLLNPSVNHYGFGIDPTEKGWQVVECSRKEYCGAGKYGHMMAGCLELHVRHAADPLDQSLLAISANDEIVSYIIEGELTEQAPEDKSSFPGLRELDLDMMEGHLSYVTGYVQMADENIIILTVSFPFTEDKYYLVYDAILQSMSMIPHISSGPYCHGYYPSNPLPVRCRDMYTLVHFARNMEYDDEEGTYIYRDMLCLWPPPPCSKLPPPPLPNAYTCPSIEPWYFMEPSFPKEMEMTLAQFRHHVKFTSSSYAFWADLTLGILCCCCSDIFDDNYYVDFSFIELPPGCECHTLDSDIGPAEMFRTMGCTTGDSIKFISISFDDSVPDTEKTVTEWMLDMATLQWTKVEELSLGTLWELEDFKKYGLPKTEPLYPLLRKGEEDDGALYFMLRNLWEDYAEQEHYMCRLDMRSKRLRSTRLSLSQSLIGSYQLVGSEFFRYLQSECLDPAHGKGKMKLNEA